MREQSAEGIVINTHTHTHTRRYTLRQIYLFPKVTDCEISRKPKHKKKPQHHM